MQNFALLEWGAGPNLLPQNDGNPQYAGQYIQGHDELHGDGEMGPGRHSHQQALGHAVCNAHLHDVNPCQNAFYEHKEHVSNEQYAGVQYSMTSQYAGLVYHQHTEQEDCIYNRMSSRAEMCPKVAFCYGVGQFDKDVHVHEAGYAQRMRHGDAQHDDDDHDEQQGQKKGDRHNIVCDGLHEIKVNAHELPSNLSGPSDQYLLPQYPTRKRPHEIVHGKEFSDDSLYASMEDTIEEGDHLLDTNNAGASAVLTRNQLSTPERSATKELNAGLLSSLRSIVPKIAKMDKASIVLDAISYVLELQKRIEDMENDISSLQMDTRNNFADEGYIGTIAVSTEDESSSHDFKIVQLNVCSLGERIFHVEVRCKKGPRILLQLSRALEALNLTIINANLVSLGEHVVNTVVIKVNGDDSIMKPDDLKEKIAEHVHMFGLHF